MLDGLEPAPGVLPKAAGANAIAKRRISEIGRMKFNVFIL